jgi:fructose-bisphosphate aldolase class II
VTLVTGQKILRKAYRGKYAVGAFNVNNLEILQAVVDAAEKTKSPIILATSEGAIKYAGLKNLYLLVTEAANNSKIPMALHLDHGRDMSVIKRCIKLGYTSVMYDGSHLPLNKNIRNTKKVVQLAHKKGVSVEAELGTIGGKEDAVYARKIIYTEPDVAKQFVKETGCDSLAIAIGTSHGAYKFAASAKLDIARLKDINKILKMPLVLHGASGVPQSVVKLAEKYGARLKHPKGVPDSQIKAAIRNGVTKINTDTDIRLSFLAGIRRFLATNKSDFDPRHILDKSIIQKTVEHRMKVFGSVKKA